MLCMCFHVFLSQPHRSLDSLGKEVLINIEAAILRNLSFNIYLTNLSYVRSIFQWGKTSTFWIEHPQAAFKTTISQQADPHAAQLMAKNEINIWRLRIGQGVSLHNFRIIVKANSVFVIYPLTLHAHLSRPLLVFLVCHYAFALRGRGVARATYPYICTPTAPTSRHNHHTNAHTLSRVLVVLGEYTGLTTYGTDMGRWSIVKGVRTIY